MTTAPGGAGGIGVTGGYPAVASGGTGVVGGGPDGGAGVFGGGRAGGCGVVGNALWVHELIIIWTISPVPLTTVNIPIWENPGL